MSFSSFFRNPPAAYRLAPFWFWNGDMDPEEIIYQICQMAEKGVGGFFICARQGLKVPYLAQEWFRLVALAVETAQQYGLEVWLYDEYPYPSGMSGGEVILQHPDARHCQLLPYSFTIEGPQTLTYDLPWARVLYAQAVQLDADPVGGDQEGAINWAPTIDLTAFIGSVPAQSLFQATGLTKYTNKRFFTASLQKQLLWDVPPGRWKITLFLEKEIDEFKYFGTYVDPCHKEAIQTFIATTYEPYARHFKEQFGQTIKGFFTDEVGLLGKVPWSPRLPAFFRKHYGYELVESLPTLLYARGEKTAQVRYHYFQSLHRLLREVYHQQMGDWCEQQHLQYIAEVPSMRMTTQLHSHITGGDSAHEKIGRSLEWIVDANAYNMRADPKIASSLASQLGVERSMIECFHSVGWSMTLQDAKWMLDRLAALGTNFFVLHAFFYSISGLRKHDAPPSQFLQNPYWQHYRQLADYAGRLGYVMSQGRASVSVAVIHPVTSLWTSLGNPFHGFTYSGSDPLEEQALERLKRDWADLRKQLLLHQIDYDHLDPELLAEATFEDGWLVLGQARYEVLVLPPLTNLEVEAWSQIKAFLRAGGKVISVGLLPYESIDSELDIAAEVLQCFDLAASPRERYWHGLEDVALDGPATEQEEVPWTQGEQSAYFIPSSGAFQHTHALEHLLALLQYCVPPVIALEPVIGERTSFLMRQRSLPDGSQLVFITHQEEGEKTLHLHLPQHFTEPRVERLDIATGGSSLLPIEPGDQNWTISLSFASYESHLLRIEPGRGVTSRAPVSPEIPASLPVDVGAEWKLGALQENVLRFGSFRFMVDRAHVGLESGWHEGHVSQDWPLVGVRPFINQCADLASKQALPIQFKQTFGSPLHSSLAYPLACWYQTLFHVEEFPSECKLVLDEDAISGSYVVYVNGHEILAQDFGLVEQHGYRQQGCDVRRFLKRGLNTLVVHVGVQRDEDGVRDPLYLMGSFGVFIDALGIPTIDKAPETGSIKSGVQKGYPYFAGTLSFTREISLEVMPERTFALVLQGWDVHIDDCVEVLVNEHSLGVCCWSPYRWQGEGALLNAGVNKVEVRVTNTLSGMLEGSYFDVRTHQIVPIA